MTTPFEPTPENSTIDGYPWKKSGIAWDDLDWAAKEWREKSTLFIAIVGEADAPLDAHWRVPHKDEGWGTWHRIRAKRGRSKKAR